MWFLFIGSKCILCGFSASLIYIVACVSMNCPKFALKQSPSLSGHCPKYYLTLCIITEPKPVTVVADATIYVSDPEIYI